MHLEKRKQRMEENGEGDSMWPLKDKEEQHTFGILNLPLKVIIIISSLWSLLILRVIVVEVVKRKEYEITKWQDILSLCFITTFIDAIIAVQDLVRSLTLTSRIIFYTWFACAPPPPPPPLPYCCRCSMARIHWNRDCSSNYSFCPQLRSLTLSFGS